MRRTQCACAEYRKGYSDVSVLFTAGNTICLRAMAKLQDLAVVFRRKHSFQILQVCHCCLVPVAEDSSGTICKRSPALFYLVRKNLHRATTSGSDQQVSSALQPEGVAAEATIVFFDCERFKGMWLIGRLKSVDAEIRTTIPLGDKVAGRLRCKQR